MGGGPVAVGGILLTGGKSRRLGFDKALLPVGGVPNAVRLAEAMRATVRGPLVEVGPGHSGLPSVREEPAGAGPLAAIAAGACCLNSFVTPGPALVLACDLPFVGAGALRVLAEWPGAGSVVPVACGLAQPLCARWSAAALQLAAELAARAKRAMKDLLAAVDVEFVDGQLLAGGSPASELLADVDTPEDLQRLGL